MDVFVISTFVVHTEVKLVGPQVGWSVRQVNTTHTHVSRIPANTGQSKDLAVWLLLLVFPSRSVVGISLQSSPSYVAFKSLFMQSSRLSRGRPRVLQPLVSSSQIFSVVFRLPFRPCAHHIIILAYRKNCVCGEWEPTILSDRPFRQTEQGFTYSLWSGELLLRHKCI